jgi:hypothetical protein
MSASTILMAGGMVILGLVLLLVGSAVALEFSWWLLRQSLIVGIQLKRELSQFLIAAVTFVLHWLARICATVLALAWELASTMFLAMCVPPARRAAAALANLRARLQAKRDALLQDDRPQETPDPVHEEPVMSNQAVVNEEPVATLEPRHGKPKVRRTRTVVAQDESDNSYKAALKILGLEDRSTFSLVDLKLQYAKLKEQIADDGDAAAISLEEIDEARATVRRTRGWA